MQDELEARIRRLERENRWARCVVLLGLVLTGGAVCAGRDREPKTWEEIRARKLCITDSTGAIRAHLRVDSLGKGRAGLVLYDREHNTSTCLYADSSEGGVRVVTSTNAIASLSASTEEAVVLLTSGPEGGHAYLRLDRTAHFGLRDSFGSAATNTQFMELRDRKGEQVWVGDALWRWRR